MAFTTILSPGVTVGGKYEVVEIIGFGGMGVVYKVREQVGGASRIRALKTILPQFASDPSVVRRFRREAEKMCMLEHENIVPVLSYSEEGEFPYLIMPFIEGQTLKEYLAGYTAEHGRGLPLSEVMEIGLELVRGLEIAHRFVNRETRQPQPMVHRDIKPGNIMVRAENDSGERRLKVLIMDFGIAKILSEKDSGHSRTEVIGTVQYASPEQIRRGKDIDPRADIYSLGMVLYELYAGHHMFSGLSEHTVLMRMVQRDLKDFEISFPEGTPQRFRQFIERCVAVDRDRRFPNVGEMRVEMGRILEEDSERVVTELAHARDRAQSERARAVERGAEQFAARTLAEGDELLARGNAAIAEHRQRQALPPLRAAAEAFACAAQESAVGRGRDRLVRGLAALAELRAVALAADAERLAPKSVAAAAETTRVVERALETGDFTGGGRALAHAEQAWGEAHDAARAERVHLDAVPELDRCIAEARAELELERTRAAASTARERAEAVLSAVERLGERAIRDARFAPGRDDIDRGRALYEAKHFAEAASRFAAGGRALAELGAEIEKAERTERLAAFARRRATVVETLAGVPTSRRAQRELKAIREMLAAADGALAAANESEATRRFDEIESRVGTLLDQVATLSAVEPGRGFAWKAVAIGGGAAASLLAMLVWTARTKPPPGPVTAEGSLTPVVSERAAAREVEPTGATEARATVPPLLEPTPAAVSAALTAAPVVEPTAPPSVAPTVAQRPAPLVLASARPKTQMIKVRAGSEPRFDVSLKNGDDESLEWRLGGETVGHGGSLVLGKETTGHPGRKRLEVVALREGSPTSLRSWDVEIEAPPLGFAALEPANRSVERPPGAPVSFRAAVNLSEGEKLAFLWRVNGEAIHGADGPAYDFQPESLGEYVVQVRATAPWGASIAHIWNLSVRPVVPTPDLSAEAERSDPRAGAQAWIQAYCTAFEKKDVNALLALDPLTSETEAARLRDALSSMYDLKVSCTNPWIHPAGDKVVVSFDRTDRWTDPRGATMERALVRITKRLHRTNGRWVAVR